jgi:hypothetical protein
MRSCFLRPADSRVNALRPRHQTDPAAPFWPPDGVGGSATGCSNTDSDAGCFIFQASPATVGPETKKSSNEPGSVPICASRGLGPVLHEAFAVRAATCCRFFTGTQMYCAPVADCQSSYALGTGGRERWKQNAKRPPTVLQIHPASSLLACLLVLAGSTWVCL